MKITNSYCTIYYVSIKKDCDVRITMKSFQRVSKYQVGQLLKDADTSVTKTMS